MEINNVLLDWLGKQTGELYMFYSDYKYVEHSVGLQHGTLGLVVMSGCLMLLMFSYCLVYGVVKTRRTSGPVIKPFK